MRKMDSKKLDIRRPFVMAPFLESLLDISDNPSNFPIDISSCFCDRIRDPIVELNNAIESNDFDEFNRIRARLFKALCELDKT